MSRRPGVVAGAGTTGGIAGRAMAGAIRFRQRLSFTTGASPSIMSLPAEKLICRRRVNQQNRIKVMGDKSPKATQKKSSQKQTKANTAAQAKKAAMLSKQAAGNKN